MTKGYAAGERDALADTLLAVGPDAPTLCAGWTTRDLAAHLVLRERHFVAASGILLKPMAGINERVQRRLAGGDYAELVGQVRRSPWWTPFRIPAVEEAANITEMFVHHEDVRRAVPGWTRRPLAGGYAEALRKRLRPSAKFACRRFPATITVRIPGHDPFRIGAGGPALDVVGDPGELTLFFTGRQRATEVEVTGAEAALADRLRAARLGF